MPRGGPLTITGGFGFVRGARGAAAERFLDTLARAGLPITVRPVGRACFRSFARLRIGFRDGGFSFRTGSGRACSPMVRAHGAGPGKTRIMGGPRTGDGEE